MKKAELNELVEKLDDWIAAVEATHDTAGRAYPDLVTARLMAEQTLMMASMLAVVQKLEAKLDASTDAIVEAVVQRTWPGVIKFDDPERPDIPQEEEEDER